MSSWALYHRTGDQASRKGDEAGVRSFIGVNGSTNGRGPAPDDRRRDGHTVGSLWWWVEDEVEPTVAAGVEGVEEVLARRRRCGDEREEWGRVEGDHESSRAAEETGEKVGGVTTEPSGVVTGEERWARVEREQARASGRKVGRSGVGSGRSAVAVVGGESNGEGRSTSSSGGGPAGRGMIRNGREPKREREEQGQWMVLGSECVWKR